MNILSALGVKSVVFKWVCRCKYWMGQGVGLASKWFSRETMPFSHLFQSKYTQPYSNESGNIQNTSGIFSYANQA